MRASRAPLTKGLTAARNLGRVYGIHREIVKKGRKMGAKPSSYWERILETLRAGRVIHLAIGERNPLAMQHYLRHEIKQKLGRKVRAVRGIHEGKDVLTCWLED